MFNKIARYMVIDEMTTQGKQYTVQELFFKEFWDELRRTFSEENNTSSATFVLERFLKILPLKTISKQALINTIENAYKEGEI
jgi:regulator of sirC expression with transglutaminase-like and TPR domain